MWGRPAKAKAVVTCPGCAGVWTVPARYAGRTVTCRACHSQALVPAQAPKAADRWTGRLVGGGLVLALLAIAGCVVLFASLGRR